MPTILITIELLAYFSENPPPRRLRCHRGTSCASGWEWKCIPRFSILHFFLPQESCHCVLRSEINGVRVKKEGEVVEDTFVQLSCILMSWIQRILPGRPESFQQFLRENVFIFEWLLKSVYPTLREGRTMCMVENVSPLSFSNKLWTGSMMAKYFLISSMSDCENVHSHRLVGFDLFISKRWH